jgi:hypothetical protein
VSTTPKEILGPDRTFKIPVVTMAVAEGSDSGGVGITGGGVPPITGSWLTGTLVVR